MRYLPILMLLLLAGCPGGKPQGTAPKSSSNEQKLKVTLLRTDLGLGDGELVRDADAALAKLAQQGDIDYTPLGDLPPAMVNEGGSGDIGLPDSERPPGSKAVGLMKRAEADDLARKIAAADAVVCSSPVTANMVLKQIASAKLKVPALIVLDDVGPKLDAPPDGTTISSCSYEVKEAAYLLGVAAGVSSKSQAFAMFTSTTDPNADTLVKAFTNGVHNRMTGGNVYAEQVMPDADEIVAPADFTGAFSAIMADPNRKIDHFIVFCGRATPSIMYGLSSKPTNGFLLGGYGDFTQVRPARVVGCIVKHPGVALESTFNGVTSAADLAARLTPDHLKLTFQNGGVDVSDFSAYAHYNQDAEDIADAVEQVRSEIEGGEIDVMKE
jgi:hypothetical protein